MTIAFQILGNFCCLTAFSAQYMFWTSAIGKPVQPFEMASSCLACLATYTFDRIASRHGDGRGSFRDLHSNAQAKRFLVLQICLFLLACAHAPRVAANTLVALPFGVAYSASSIPTKRLFLGSKNVYVVFMWTAWFFGASGAMPPSLKHEWNVVLLYSAHMFLSNVVMDVKDIEQDRINNIPTLPAFMGKERTNTFVRVYVFGLMIVSYHVLKPSLAIAYAVQSGVLYAVDLAKGEQATAFVVSLMMLPQLVDMCARGHFGVPLACAVGTALAARECVRMVARGDTKK